MNHSLQTQNDSNYPTQAPGEVQKSPGAMLHFTPKRHRLRAAVIQPRGIATVSTDRCLSGAVRQLPNRCKINSRRTGAKLTPQRLTLLSARQLLLGHKPQGKVEQKASMVPYQEVQGTSQTPCVGSRAGSQPGSSNAPPAGLIWSHRLDAAAAAGAEPSLQDCPHTTWATGLRVVPASYGVQENPNQNVIHVLITIIDQIINHRAACNFHISFFTLFILMFVTD